LLAANVATETVSPGREVLVEWEGLPQHDATWEDKDQLRHEFQLEDEFFVEE
jgi:plastocyanin